MQHQCIPQPSPATTEEPPQRGLTRENTGTLFGHPFPGYYLTPEFEAEVMARVDARQGVDASQEAPPHLSRRAVHRDTAPTPESARKGRTA